ncbi:RNA-binding protein 39 [Clonorchis sinensis]|uniref:RNA-binding protein 39 n=1 Tax=Clonorchis sinensis TaxID=79923 RepID=G7YAL2_CLOSI|nr:RNA-binding protein 39 [Clonorchis sinensis]
MIAAATRTMSMTVIVVTTSIDLGMIASATSHRDMKNRVRVRNRTGVASDARNRKLSLSILAVELYSCRPELTPEERDARTVFVWQLSARIRQRDLEDFFTSVGKIRDVRLIMDNKTKRSKGIAYVEFREVESAQLALGLTGTRLLGVPIQIQQSHAEKNRMNAIPSVPKPTQQNRGPMKLYIGSLHYNITEEMLKGIFEPFGKIDDIKLIKDPATGRSQGYGFVTYANSDDAKKALDQLNGFELAGRPMKVNHVTERGEYAALSALDNDDADRAGVDLGTTGRLALMAKLAEGTGLEIPKAALAQLHIAQNNPALGSASGISSSSAVAPPVLAVKKSLNCNTLPVPSCHANRGKHEGWDTARLPKPRQGSREAEVGFEPRTFRSVHSRCNQLHHLAPVLAVYPILPRPGDRSCSSWNQCAYVTRFIADKLNRLTEYSLLYTHHLLVGKRKHSTTRFAIHMSVRGCRRLSWTSLGNLAVSQPSCFLRVAWQLGTERVLQLNDFFLGPSTQSGTDDAELSPRHVDCSSLGLDNLVVSQPSSFFRMAWQLGTVRVLRLPIRFWVTGPFLGLRSSSDLYDMPKGTNEEMASKSRPHFLGCAPRNTDPLVNSSGWTHPDITFLNALLLALYLQDKPILLQYSATCRQIPLSCGQTFEGPIFLSMFGRSTGISARAAQAINPVEPEQPWVVITLADTMVEMADNQCRRSCCQLGTSMHYLCIAVNDDVLSLCFRIV